MTDSGDHLAAVVTTVIPTYNRSRLLRRAIDSVQNQTVDNIVICVYDNASTDDTERIVREMARRDSRIVYHRHAENIGSVPNFQFGLQRVQTPFFSVLADDDLLLPRFYETALKHLARHESAQFAIGVTLQMDSAGTIYRANAKDLPEGFYRAPDALLLMLRHYAPQWTGMLFRNEVRATVGPLDERVLTPDLDFQFRMAGVCDGLLFHEPVAIFNTHPGSTSYRLRHHTVWPSWRYMVENLTKEPRLSAPVRLEAETLLTRRIRHLMLRMGWEALAYNDVTDARTVAEILEREFGLRAHAYCLSVGRRAGERSRLGAAAVRAAYGLRRRWKRLRMRSVQKEFSSYANRLRTE